MKRIFFSNDSGNLFENHILKRLILKLKHLSQIIELVSVQCMPPLMSVIAYVTSVYIQFNQGLDGRKLLWMFVESLDLQGAFFKLFSTNRGSWDMTYILTSPGLFHLQ